MTRGLDAATGAFGRRFLLDAEQSAAIREALIAIENAYRNAETQLAMERSFEEIADALPSLEVQKNWARLFNESINSLAGPQKKLRVLPIEISALMNFTGMISFLVDAAHSNGDFVEPTTSLPWFSNGHQELRRAGDIIMRRRASEPPSFDDSWPPDEDEATGKEYLIQQRMTFESS